VGFSEQQPARFVLRGLEDATRKKDSAVEERLDI
jgi:hypothetical protein